MTTPEAFGARTRKPSRSTAGGLVIALIVVVVWSLANAVRRLGSPAPGAGIEPPAALIAQDIGYAAGGGLLVGGVTSLILFFTYVKQRAPERGTKHFLILWATASAVGLLPILLGLAILATDPARSGAETRRQDAAIMADHEARSTAVLDGLDTYRRVAEAQAKLLPHAVAAPGGVERARQAVVELRTLEQTVQAGLKVVMDETEAKLLALDLTDSQRDAMQRELASEQARAERARTLSRRAVEIQGLQIEVLARRPRGWRLQGDSIAFSRRQDLEDFNALAEELRSVGTEMEALRARPAAEATQP